MFKPISPQPNFPELEKEILKFWDDNKIFDKASSPEGKSESFVFFEGPPTANGRPGLHHAEGRSFKDVILRFQSMLGKFVLRKAGWDTHGLAVELEVEKDLGISGKPQIENLVPGDPKKSIEKFNELCRQSVWKYKDEWERFTRRMGFWIDLKRPYITYENAYIESVWSILKKFWDKNLIYQGHKVLPYCTRCGTALSSHEVAQGYKSIEEASVYVKFLVADKKIISRDKTGSQTVVTLDQPTYILSWTTTPWTLPGNVALAVGPDIAYIIARREGSNYIVAKERAEMVLGQDFTVLETVKGKDLLGLRYQQLFTVPELSTPTAFQVYSASFVNTTDGTGVVHTAVMYGEDDYNLGTEKNLPKFHTVDEEGKFVSAVRHLAGRYVKDPETEKLILSHLQKSHLLFKQEPYRHDYPFCWRCGTPLLYYARDSWFIRMSQLREALLKNNQQINWVPEYIKDGRFGGWLAEIKDWAISRERYWGTPLPIWQCGECKEYTCVGSVEELQSMAVKSQILNSKSETNLKSVPVIRRDDTSNDGVEISNPKSFDLHRPYIDDVELKCEKCNQGTMRRVPQVLDVWFDSGAMPFAQWHYPFENRERIEHDKSGQDIDSDELGLVSDHKAASRSSLDPEKGTRDDILSVSLKCQFPADYITEGLDQTRGWFYTLLAVSTALGYDFPPYKNVICLGLLLDEKGQKMSKSKGNIVEPQMLADKYGMDIVRWYMYSVNQPGDPKLFSEAELSRMQRRLQMILWNVYNYFVTYSTVAGWHYEKPLSSDAKLSVLDRWILARLGQLVHGVGESLLAYNIFRAARDIEEFVQDLSTWYLRRSRGRGDAEFFSTLYHVLLTLTKLLAPFMPFFAESIYQNLRSENDPESVHLASWPKTSSLESVDRGILGTMQEVRAVIESVLAFRKEHQLKVRQPLSLLAVKTKNSQLENYKYLLQEELNFLQIVVLPVTNPVPADLKTTDAIAARPGHHEELLIDSRITPELAARGLAREFERAVQNLRKESGLKVGQMVELYYETQSKDVYDALEFFDAEKTYVKRVVGARSSADYEKNLKIGETEIWIGLKEISAS